MNDGYQAVLRNRNFRFIWIGQATSLFGDAFHDLALIWLALQITNQDYWSLGLVMFARFVPYLFFGMVGGVISDRWDRKKIMIISDILRALFVLALPIIDIAGQLEIWHLALIAFLLTTMRTFFQPSMQASIAQIVPEAQLVPANALLHASYQLASVLGPVIAGVLFTLMPVRVLFAFDSITYLLSALLLMCMALPHPIADPQAARTSVRQELADTVGTLRGSPVVLWSVVLSALAIFIIAGILRLGLPAFTEQQLRSGPEVYGLLMGSMGLGTVAGALLTGRLRSKQYGLLLFLGWVTYGLLFIALSPLTWLPLALVVTALIGCAGALVDVMLVPLILVSVPEQQMGKVLSLFSTLANLGESLSGLLIGSLLGLLPIVVVLAGSGVATVIVGLTGLFLVWQARRALVASQPQPDRADLIEQLSS